MAFPEFASLLFTSFLRSRKAGSATLQLLSQNLAVEMKIRAGTISITKESQLRLLGHF